MPNWKKVVTSGSNAHLNHITASGNISASGTGSFGYIKAAELQDTSISIDGGIMFSTGDGVLTNSNVLNYKNGRLSSTSLIASRSAVMNETGHATGDFRVEGSGNTHLLFTDASSTTVGINTVSPSASLDITGDLRVSTDITASGNISASGKLFVTQTIVCDNDIQAGVDLKVGRNIEHLDDSNTKIEFDTDEISFGAGGSNHLILNKGHITASGNISSSGNIINTGNITTDGILDITNTTDSSNDSGDTGALRVEGGASIAKKLYVGTDLDVDGTTNLDAVDIDSTVQIDGATTFGVDGTGYFVKFFGDTSGRYMKWVDNSDHLKFRDNTKIAMGNRTSDGNADFYLYHDGSNTLLEPQVGDLIVSGSGTTLLEVKGNISSSGTLISNEIDVRGDITASGHISASSTSFFSGQDGFFTREIRVGGATSQGTEGIAVNGDISASGTVIINKLQIDEGGVVTPSIFPKGDTDTGISFTSANSIAIQAGGTTPEFLINQNQVVVQGQAESVSRLEVKGRISCSLDIETNSHITASGNISSSGFLQAKHLILSGGSGVFTSASLAAGGGGGGSFNNFTLTADGGSNQTIDDGNTLDIAGGSGITTAVGATDTVTVNLDNSLTNVTTLTNSSLQLNQDGNCGIDLRVADEIDFNTGGSTRLKVSDDSSEFAGNILMQPQKFLYLSSSNTGFRELSNRIIYKVNSNAASHIFTDNHLAINGDTNAYTSTDPPATLTVQGDISASGQLNVGILGSTDGHITASGNISASGKVTANEFEVIGSGTAELEVDGHITASGNISASGTSHIFAGTTTLDTTLTTTNKFEKTSNTDADHQGDVVFFGGTTSMDAGKIYAYGGDGKWNLSDADYNNLSGSGLLGVALGAASDTNGMLLRGTVTLDHDPGAVGDVLYLSTTAGQATSTPTSGSADIIRVIGYCLDASNGQIWFNPSSTFVEAT